MAVEVTTDQLYALVKRQQEVVKRAVNGGLPIEDALAGTQGILDRVYPPASPASLFPSWYVAPERQIQRVADLLASIGGEEASWFIPEPTNFIPRTPTEVLMLAVYLPDKGRKKGLHRTFDILWDAIIPPSGFDKWRWDQLKSDSKHLRLLLGTKHRPGVRWIVFDPNANHKRSPQACWEDDSVNANLAGPEVLMAAVLLPDWAASWDGNKSPYPNLPGYQFYWEAAWQFCPCLGRWDAFRQMELGADWAAVAHDAWSCPSFREC